MFSCFPRRVLDSENVNYIVFSRETNYLLDANTFFFFLRYCSLRRCYSIMFILFVGCYIRFMCIKNYIIKIYCKHGYILHVG